MSIIVQHRRDSRTNCEANTPATGEVWYDTTLKAVRWGDGATLGGFLQKLWGKSYTVSPSQITSNQNDYSPTDLAIAETLFINSDAARSITGLALGATNRKLALINNGSFNITLVDASASSTAANRFSFGPSVATDFVLRPKATVLLIYSAAASRWLLLADGLRPTTTLPEIVQRTGSIAPTQLSANTNDWAPTDLATTSVIRASTDASRNLTGLSGGVDGREFEIHNVGSNALVLKDQDANSTAANRFLLGSDVTLSANQTIKLWYDLTTARWRQVSNTAGAAVGDSAVTAVKLAGSAVPYGVGMVNGTIVESHAGNAATFAVKTLAGTDPSATNPVLFVFRNATAATGDYVVRSVTAALSLVISSGSSMGFTNGVAGRIWLGALDNAGTVELFAVNCVSGKSIYALGQFPLITTTAEGGAGAADSAQVPYSATARTSKAYVPLGYASYETGLATAGTWAASPTRIQLYGQGVPLPGQRVQLVRLDSSAVATGTTTIPEDNTIPQNTEGDQYMSQAITPASASNLLRIRVQGQFSNSASAYWLIMALFQDTTASALAAIMNLQTTATGGLVASLDWLMLAATTSSTTFKMRAGGAGAGTTTFNGQSGSGMFNGTMNSWLEIEELQT